MTRPKATNMIQTLKYLIPYLKQYRVKYIVGAVFVIFTNIFRIVNPRIVQSAIDYLKTDFALSRLGMYASLIVLFALLEGIFLFLMRKSMIVASREIENDLRNDFFEKLLQLQPTYYQNIPTGDIMARATNDLSAVRSVLGPGIAYSVNTITAFIFVIPMMLIISPRLSLFALLPFPLIAVLVNRFGKAIHHRFEKIQEQFSALSTRAQENLSGSSIIKWFVREKHEIEEFRKLNFENMQRNISFVKVQAGFHPVLMFVIGLATALIILFGGKLVIDDKISLGEFTAFMLYMGILIWPSIALGWVIGLFQQGAASMNRMRQVLETEPEIVELPTMITPKKFNGEITFKDLSFGYEEETRVLQGISIHFPAQQTIGIIGPTGSGKTTLVQLIPHFYKLPPGHLFIDGIDLNDISVKFLRSRIGYVPQETFLFSNTIRNNIAYGKPDATQEEIEWAAKMAHIHEEIQSFPDQYESILGEKGLNLSGGQKQRVAIARAILYQPEILILDDAFSALDTYTEERILTNLEDFFPDRTVLLVSHRISTLQNCDHIIVMEDGGITEQGNHEELLAARGLYAWIHEKQLLEEELEQVE
jgi:ATP-binding cassette subfamily B multidrug efflux pump